MKRIRVTATSGPMARATAVLATALAPVASAATAPPSKSPPGPVIHTEDVTHFFALYDSTCGHPTADQLQHYIDTGSDGLHELAKARDVTGARMATTLTAHPEIYSNAKNCLNILPRVRQRLSAALHKLGQLYPEAKFPPVTIAVGRGKPVGIGSPVTGVQIGLEALCATTWLNPNLEDRFVYVITHEYAHVQQVAALVDDEHPSVLEISLIEGAAELAAELTAGSVAYAQLGAITRGHEKEIETAFVADEDLTDLHNWVYNSTTEKPGDLGYWVGYRIVKTYYQHGTDKRLALREILQMNDPKALLKKSGWYPGIDWPAP